MTPEEKIRQIKNKYSGKLRIIQQKVALQLAKSLVDYIKLRTREQGEGTSGTLKSLSKKYVEQRAKQSDRLHPDTSPSNSNLTATGQMLDAIRGRAGGGKVTIDIKPTNRRKELNGKRSGLNNNQVRQYVEDAGREFLKLSPQEKQEVIDLATQLINDELADLS
jgi:hypothetical protein